MAYGKRQRRIYKRRANGTTDYHRRLKLLRSGAPRAVVRVANTQILCQLVNYEVDGDTIITSTGSNKLCSKYKWPAKASNKSIPACYVAGYALAKQAIAAGHGEAVLDIGLAAATQGNRVFAALKGMVDGGLEVPHSEDIFPSEERLSGEHIDKKISAAVTKSKKAIEEANK